MELIEAELRKDILSNLFEMFRQENVSVLEGFILLGIAWMACGHEDDCLIKEDFLSFIEVMFDSISKCIRDETGFPDKFTISFRNSIGMGE